MHVSKPCLLRKYILKKIRCSKCGILHVWKQSELKTLMKLSFNIKGGRCHWIDSGSSRYLSAFGSGSSPSGVSDVPMTRYHDRGLPTLDWSSIPIHAPPKRGGSMSILWAWPHRGEPHPPGAHLYTPTHGLAPGWGLDDINLGDVIKSCCRWLIGSFWWCHRESANELWSVRQQRCSRLFIKEINCSQEMCVCFYSYFLRERLFFFVGNEICLDVSNSPLKCSSFTSSCLSSWSVPPVIRHVVMNHLAWSAYFSNFQQSSLFILNMDFLCLSPQSL